MGCADVIAPHARAARAAGNCDNWRRRRVNRRRVLVNSKSDGGAVGQARGVRKQTDEPACTNLRTEIYQKMALLRGNAYLGGRALRGGCQGDAGKDRCRLQDRNCREESRGRRGLARMGD